MANTDRPDEQTSPDLADPDDKVRQLLAENELLRKQLLSGAPPIVLAPAPPRPGRWRAPVAAILIILGVLLSPTAVVASWVKAEVTDTTRFVETLGPLADDPAVQSVLVDEIVKVVNENVDFKAIAADVFDGIASLNLPPRAASALQLLEQPAVEGMQSLVRSATERVIESPAFADLWQRTLQVTHTQLLNVLEGNTSSALVLNDKGELGIQLKPVIAAVKDQLVSQGLTFAANIPEVDRTIVIAQADGLLQARTGYTILNALGYWLPIISIVLMAAGVLIAKKRARALIWTGVGLAFMMLILGSGIAVGRVLFVGSVSPAYIPSNAARSIYDAILPFITNTTISVGVVGIGLAIVAYLAGPFRGSASIRRATVSTAAKLRTSAERNGITTGRFGEFLYRGRRWIRVIIALCVAAVILFWRPLTVPVIIWTAVIALILILLLELLLRPVSVGPANTADPGNQGNPGDPGDPGLPGTGSTGGHHSPRGRGSRGGSGASARPAESGGVIAPEADTDPANRTTEILDGLPTSPRQAATGPTTPLPRMGEPGEPDRPAETTKPG
ncbi:hypothetical protein [Leifsonia sp. A12D58]|uniref:hypothetical protein n=1 Tax=Leifsonia sp. A12D58 TaxID=3397674 RepID=UPI0039DF8082